MLKLSDAFDLLGASLEEESKTDELLTRIADAEVNARAARSPK